MYFCNIEYAKNETKLFNTMIEKLNEESFIIVPIVNPTSDFGEYLSNKKNTELIDQISGNEVTILYVSKDKFYKSYLKVMLKFIDDTKLAKKVKEPCFLIFWPKRKKLKILSNIADNSLNDLTDILLTIIDCLKTNNPVFSLNNFLFKYKINEFMIENNESVMSIFKCALEFLKESFLSN